MTAPAAHDRALRVFVVDDERLAVERLTRLLQATGRVELAGSTTDPEEALAMLREQPVDVLFLDIQMPGLTGFELLDALAAHHVDVCVIFTTAYDEHALRAFSVNSVDYLLKPIEPARLTQALDKLVRLTRPARSGAPAEPAPPSGRDIRALARELAAELTPGRRLERLASRSGERTTLLEVARISHFASRDKLTYATAGGREYAVDLTLTELEARLDPRRFVRIHRGTLVNLAFVQELDTWVDGGLRVRLKDEGRTELTVARDRVKALKTALGI